MKPLISFGLLRDINAGNIELWRVSGFKTLFELVIWIELSLQFVSEAYHSYKLTYKL